MAGQGGQGGGAAVVTTSATRQYNTQKLGSFCNGKTALVKLKITVKFVTPTYFFCGSLKWFLVKIKHLKVLENKFDPT